MHATVPWPLVGSLDPASLADARLEAHHAAQLVVHLSIAYLPAAPDDSHTNLEWMPGQALAGHPIPGSPSFRGALRLDPLILMLLGESGDVLDEYRLEGRTLLQALRWLRERMPDFGMDPGRLAGQTHYEIPAHPVGEGAAFQGHATRGRELARYYHGAARALAEIAAARRDASPVRCWPHHFDIATLITLAPGRTVGAGLSPGDGSYAEPYYYVSPYPHPKGPLPHLGQGAWHTNGWVGAVLTGSQVARALDADRQQVLVDTFLRQSIAACEALP